MRPHPAPAEIDSVDVTINKEKPRKGAFVVTVVGADKPVVQLLDMPRPFSKLKALTIEDVASDVKKAVDKLG